MSTPRIPLDDFMGFTKTVRGPGDVVVAAQIDEHLHNQSGVLHGGVLVAMMDSAMGGSMSSLLEPGQRTTNTEIQARFIRATTTGTLVAEATIVKRGKTMTFFEAQVTNGAGEIVATGSSAFLQLD